MSTITRMAIDQYLKEHNQELEESHQEPTAIETPDSGDAQASGGA